MNASAIRIEDLNHPDGGHAVVVLPGAVGAAPREVAIRRFDTQQNHLSENGWQSFEARIVPDAIEIGDGEIYVTLGPSITQWIDYGDRIEIQIVDTPLRGVASWPEVASYTGAGAARGRRLMSSAAVRQAFQPRQPPPQPVGEPPVGQATVIQPRQMFPPPPPMPPPQDPRHEPVVKLSEPPPRKGRGWIHAVALIVCLLVVAAAAGAAWQYTQCGELICRGGDQPPPVPQPDPQRVVQTPPQPPQPPQPPPTQQQTPPPTQQAAVPPTPGCSSPLDAACLATRAPEDIFRDGQALFAQGSLDPGLLMYEVSAQRGYGPAMTAQAKLYDPATFQQGRPFSRPNPRRALDLYSAAIAAGDSDAQPLRAALLERLRAQADGGGQGAEDARRILEDFARNPGLPAR